MRACGLSDGARLVRVLHRIDPIAARRYADALAGMVNRAIARRHVVDRTEHWLDIGWAAHAVTDSLSAVPLGTTQPPVLPDVLDAGIGTWSVMWLAPVEWVERVHTSAMGMVTRSGPPKSPAAAATSGRVEMSSSSLHGLCSILRGGSLPFLAANLPEV